MAQQLKALAAKPDDLNSIPEVYMVDRENQFLCCPCPFTCELWYLCVTRVDNFTLLLILVG